MTLSRLRIISRESPLAMWQANHVRDLLRAAHPGLDIEIIGVTTEADRFLNVTLESLGGKGAFVKELEQALLEQRADIAVHSMKDVTIDLPDGLALPAILEREDVRDVFVSNRYPGLDQLPTGARIGTSSLRRRCQLQARRSDLRILDIRGNVGTRFGRLDEGRYDALILAAAGVKRLGWEERVTEYLTTDTILPAIGQGALGIETRAGDTGVLELIRVLDHPLTHTCVSAERALSRRLNGGCHAPVAGLATIDGEQLQLLGLVGRLDGSELVSSRVTGAPAQAEVLGESLGAELLQSGAHAILRDLGHG